MLPDSAQPAATSDDRLLLAGKEFRSRLLVGTGKYKNLELAATSIAASGAEIITVAVRRVNLAAAGEKTLQDYLPPEDYTYLPNSAGCYTSEEAVRVLRLGCESLDHQMVKLEVIGDSVTLYPDMLQTLEATEALVKEGFFVMTYCNDDPVMAKRLEDAGAGAIMPLAAPIGSGLGIQNPLNIQLIVEQARIPVLVDAGVGTASDAAIAMELGCDGVLMNTAIAEAKDPIRMAEAMQLAVASGRLAYRAGRMPKKAQASASSPEEGTL